MMNRIKLCIGVIFLILFVGLAGAQSPDIKYSFEQNTTENWNVIDQGAGPIDRNSSLHTDGFYSLQWQDTGSSVERSFLRTRDVGFVNPEYTNITFDWQINTTGTERDAFEIKLITPEEIIVIYGVDGVQQNQFVAGSNVNVVSTGKPPNNEWHNVTILIEGKSIVTHIDNETLRTNMSEPIQNPNDIKLAIEFDQSTFDSNPTNIFIDNIVIDTTPMGLTSFQSSDILLISFILLMILYAGVRLRSAATIVLFSITGLSAVGIIWLDLPFRVFWSMVLISFGIITVSAFIFYKY